MASYNDITGNCLVTKPATEAYRNNFDAVFGKKKAEAPAPVPTETTAEEDEAWLALAEDARKGGNVGDK